MRILAVLVAIVFGISIASSQDGRAPDPKDNKKGAAKEENPPKDEEVDVQKTTERIADNAQKAGDRLKEKDPGESTRIIQREIIKDIDALIKKAQNPPPPPKDSEMSPMPPPPMKDGMPPPKDGSSGGNAKEKNGGSSGNSPANGNQGANQRPRRERRPRGNSPMGSGEQTPQSKSDNKDPASDQNRPTGGKDSEPQPKDEGTSGPFGKASPKRQNDKLADLYKDVWGQLPERLRQEMDLYYREKFMPRYSELLRQYYTSLAEQKKSGSEGRK